MGKQITRTYTSDSAFRSDIENMQKHGWVLVNHTSHKDEFDIGKGCCLGFIFLPLMIFGRGKTKIIATYEYKGQTNRYLPF